MAAVTFKVVGVTFKNEDGRSRAEILDQVYLDWWTEGKSGSLAVELRAEPDNEVDPWAIGVWLTQPKELAGRIGFVGRDDQAEVRKKLLSGRVRAKIDDMGCNASAKVYLTVRVA